MSNDLKSNDSMNSDEMTNRAQVTPRVRWAAIVWAVIVGAAAFLCLFVLGSTQRQADVSAWLSSLNSVQATVMSVSIAGGLILILGLLALLRRRS